MHSSSADQDLDHATREETADALNTLIPVSAGHAQKVLLHSIGTCPDVDPSLLGQSPTTARKPGPLPTLEVPKSPRTAEGEDAPGTARSFIDDSSSHAQKVLIHSIASDDTQLMTEISTPNKMEEGQEGLMKKKKKRFKSWNIEKKRSEECNRC